MALTSSIPIPHDFRCFFTSVYSDVSWWLQGLLTMERKRLKAWDFAAFVLVLLAFLLQVAGYFIPTWWTYNDPQAQHKIVVSMLGSTENEAQVERTKTVIEIEGGRGESQSVVTLYFWNIYLYLLFLLTFLFYWMATEVSTFLQQSISVILISVYLFRDILFGCA